jgi:hypothetical protein
MPTDSRLVQSRHNKQKDVSETINSKNSISQNENQTAIITVESMMIKMSTKLYPLSYISESEIKQNMLNA